LTVCRNKLKDLLPWYLNKTLPEDEAKKVESHLKECPECQRELEEIKLLSSAVKEHSEIFESSHIDSERLVLFAEEPKSLHANEVISIEKHLRSCPLCYEELQTLKRASFELEAIERKEKSKLAKEASVWEKITERLIWLARQPALAYIIILLLAYPAYRGLFLPSQLKMPALPIISSEKVYVLSEQTRETTEPISVFRNSKDKQVRVGVPFWADLENESYELAIKSETGQNIFLINDFTDWGNQGFFQLVLNTDSIPDGRYILIIRETNKKDSTIFSETHFPFQIIRAKD